MIYNIEVTKAEIDNAMLVPGEYEERGGKFYVPLGMLDGYIHNDYYKTDSIYYGSL